MKVWNSSSLTTLQQFRPTLNNIKHSIKHWILNSLIEADEEEFDTLLLLVIALSYETEGCCTLHLWQNNGNK